MGVMGRLFNPIIGTLFAMWRLRNAYISALDVVPCRPMPSDAGLFCTFLECHSLGRRALFHQQHPDVVPSCFTEKNHPGWLGDVCHFIRSFASPLASDTRDGGISLLRTYFGVLGSGPLDRSHCTRRSVLSTVLRQSLISCGPWFRATTGLAFLAHVVMADMDSCIPGICGDVGIDTIVFGTGSFIGMQLCCLNMKRRPALEKLKAFHANRHNLIK